MRDDLPEGVTRETMEVDVLIVGGGAAGLSCALHLQNLVQKHNQEIGEGKRQGQPVADPMIAVLEKGPEIGAHSFSGAVLNPSALRELIPDYKEQGCPIDSEVKKDAVYYLGNKFALKFPITPPPFHNKGKYIISLSKFNRWLGSQCEAKGINIFAGFAAVEALYEGNKIVGIRTGDKGRDKNGNPKSNFEAGYILKSKCVVFAEGPRGSLFKKVSQHLNLREGKHPEYFEEGVKEIIQMPAGTVEPGQVIHTLGFPLKKSIGGTFIYTIPGDKIILGLVSYLDSKDPLLDPHRDLQKLKTHPFVANMIKGGKVITYGGKTIPAGGWYSMPKLYGNGWMVAGDTASMVDVQKLKGIHLAMKSGMLAAEVALEGLVKGDFSEGVTKTYEDKIHSSYVKKDLYRVRNFHHTLSKGIFQSMPSLALQELTGGWTFGDGKAGTRDPEATKEALQVWQSEEKIKLEMQLPKADSHIFFDKLSSVYMTGTMHDEDSPNHLLVEDKDVCRTVCQPKYKSPCNSFCPANVYEMVPSKTHPGQKDLMVNYTNCIHCKTCDIKCPFENIEWTTPEGGGGPKYTET